MEHLTKQQIVLLTLFTSFVTSIATGIVTVALVDQAPVGVTSTINHVIERTVQEVTAPSGSNSGTNQSASVSNAVVFSDPADQIANATAIAQKSLVRIQLGNNVTGLGVIVSSNGIIMSDKSAIALLGNYVAVMSDGTQYPVTTLQSQDNGDVVFLLAQAPIQSTVTGSSSKMFTPASFAPLYGADAPRLGETVIALSGSQNGGNSTIVNEGILKKINKDVTTLNASAASSTISSFETNIDPSEVVVGSPLFDSIGRILGIKTIETQSGNFYPIGNLKSVIPSL
jgi:hypothetical protein